MSTDSDLFEPDDFWRQPIVIATIAGLVPFLAALLFTFLPLPGFLDRVVFERAVIGYGALILAFLGGVRWGLHISSEKGGTEIYLAGIAGSVLGFFTLLLPYTVALSLLVIGFAGHGVWDVWTGFRGGLPRVYVRLRTYATFAVCALLIAILLSRGLITG